ncbi:hypothetical protein LI221_05610 [Faecalimonas umbilicata]|nr:hypothetical protein [Faecalimonas umbilicata]
MFQDFKVDILGTEYAVCFVDEFPERLGEYQDNADGLCNRYSREIFVKRCKDKSVTEQGRERSEKDTLRHELLYAYFAESGLSANASPTYSSWAENEEMVDWFAIQSPKIFKTFTEVGCL